MTPEERVDISRCRNDIQRKEVSAISEDGYFVMTVTDSKGTDWCYTMGLWHTYQHPEIILIGMPTQYGHIYLRNIHDLIAEKGRTFCHESSANDVIEGFDSFFQTIDPENYGEWLVANQWFYDTEDDFPVVQMIWPDIYGVYPWQNAASQHFKEAQPILSGLPKRFHN